MATYYGIATNDKGVNVIIDNLPSERIKAVKEAETHCKKNGLTFQYVRPVKHTLKQDGVLTKDVKKNKGKRLNL